VTLTLFSGFNLLTMLFFSKLKIMILLEVAAQSHIGWEKTALNETLVASFISLLLLAVP
jgi:hypothetical protein